MNVDLVGTEHTELRIFRREAPVRVLGPGARAVVWVQGCSFRCKNCIVPESWNPTGGEVIPVPALADWVLAQPDIEGLTLSGGEPMEQAEPLCRLVDLVRSRADVGIVCFTGYTLEHLRHRASPDQIALLDRVDLLVDGTYVERRHADLLWRGSSNQRLLPLTPRYRTLLESVGPEEDRSAGIEVVLDAVGALAFSGVPKQPGFRAEFERRLMGHGVLLRPEKDADG